MEYLYPAPRSSENYSGLTDKKTPRKLLLSRLHRLSLSSSGDIPRKTISKDVVKGIYHLSENVQCYLHLIMRLKLY